MSSAQCAQLPLGKTKGSRAGAGHPASCSLQGCAFGNYDKEPNFGQISLGGIGVLASAALAWSGFSLTVASLQQEEISSYSVCPGAPRSCGALKGEPGWRRSERITWHVVHVPLKSGACQQPRLARACHRQIPPSCFWLMPIEASGKLVGAEQMGALARRRGGKQGCSRAGM